MTEIEEDHEVGDADIYDAAEQGESPGAENNLPCTDSTEPPKKRRRTAKPNSDKKFECRHEGCGKSYSRAEHLYRHQLNHTPKTIYRCDFPDCTRYFVRQDLCIRHKERHTTHGSQLQKRDTFAQSTSNQHAMAAAPYPQGLTDGDGYTPAGQLYQHSTTQNDHNLTSPMNGEHDSHHMGQPPHQVSRPSISTASSSSALTDARFKPLSPHMSMAKPEAILHRVNSSGSTPLSPEQRQFGYWPEPPRRHSSNASMGMKTQLSNNHVDTRGQGTVPQSPIRTYSASSTSTNPVHIVKSQSDSIMANSGVGNGYYVPASVTSTNYTTPAYDLIPGSRHPNAAFAAAVTQGLNAVRTDPMPYSSLHQNMSTIDMNAAYGYPVFGSEDHNRSSLILGDDFTAWLFSENQINPMGYSPSTYMSGLNDPLGTQIQGPYFSHSPTSTNASNSVSVQHPMSVHHLLDFNLGSKYIMSEDKRQELLDIMRLQFIERPHDAVKKRKDSVFEGDVDADGHILCLRMMHTYIGSYWYHQHAQLPILHKPTFSADRTPNLLLLVVIAIGAATLDKAHGTSLTDSAAEFANFIAWHIRWEIVRDADFRPPAKLWVFQTLLLIEVYEKMYATRALHERAHIHHDSTLTLMRRGSSLLGRSASDSPPSLKGETGGRVVKVGNEIETTKSEESWHRWITTEATRRVAFAAFVIDSIHATMFGHAAKMVAHEMRLPLPCDEGLWSAVSPAEVGRVQTSLQTNGIMPVMFLEGLKRTLSGQRVRTNSFGRTVIMAGLLSVSWHMTQRDLQISSLGPRTAHSFGGPDKWKGVLLRAFDNWKRDFDEALAESAQIPSSPMRNNSGTPVLLRPVDDENIFESRTVLHHLAHIAAHVDVVECQVFAGANRLLGRSITPKDYISIREKIEKWATKASARDAAFYALKFISQVLIPPSEGSNGIDGRIYGHASPILPQAFEQNQYMARDDFLLNRPWVLYISALVVWCYGFALEGPIIPTPNDSDFSAYEQREADMRDYLDRVAGVRAPDDLENVTGKNRCLGLLMILRDSFASTRWELTHEASGLLDNACNKLMGMDIQKTSVLTRSEQFGRSSMANNTTNNSTRRISTGLMRIPQR